MTEGEQYGAGFLVKPLTGSPRGGLWLPAPLPDLLPVRAESENKMSTIPNWMDAEPLGDSDVSVIIIDIGYVTDESARNRADEIFALGVGKKNLVWGPSTGDPRIHMHIPKTKKDKVFSALPISDKKTWFGATHSYHSPKKKARKSCEAAE